VDNGGHLQLEECPLYTALSHLFTCTSHALITQQLSADSKNN
jgi:hypothetical protein